MIGAVLRRRLLVAGALFACFWATASVAQWFSDRPFYYQGRPNWVNDLAASSTRWLPTSESLLFGAALVFLLPAIIVAAHALSRETAVDPFDRFYTRRVPTLAVLIAVLGAAFIQFVLLRGQPILDDERAYLFQAKLFASGHVGLPSPPRAFANPLILTQPMWTSGYTPGHSLVLAPAAAIHLEHVWHVLMAGVFTAAVAGYVRIAFGAKHAALAAVLAACSPFVWAIYGTALAFTTSVTCLAVFLYAVVRADRGRATWMLLAGVMAGIAFITRPYEALAFCAPAALRMVYEVRRAPLRPVFALVGFAAIAWVLFWHDNAVTGDPLSMPYNSPTMPAFKLGFTKAMSFGELVHSPLQAIGNLVGVVQRMDLWLLAFPGSLVFVIAGAIRKSPTRDDALLRATVVMFVLFYVLVPYPGTWDVGPTYYFALAPALIPLAVRGIGAWRHYKITPWLVSAGLAINLTAIAPIHAIHLGSLAAQIRAPWTTIADANLGKAIVIVPPIDARRAPGWAHGYPYEIGDVHLIAPMNQKDLDDAIRYLGPQPVYQLVLDKDFYTATGDRRFSLEPLQPSSSSSAGSPAASGSN
ncbi:MAG: glycosyltransferase family 39 protein [Kofleriaceae bacterium]